MLAACLTAARGSGESSSAVCPACASRSAFAVANEALYVDEYGDLGDYRPALTEYGSVLEMVFAIFTNVLEIGPHGVVTNQGKAARRAAQYVRTYVDPGYTEEPRFEQWEIELH